MHHLLLLKLASSNREIKELNEIRIYLEKCLLNLEVPIFKEIEEAMNFILSEVKVSFTKYNIYVN